MAISGYNNQIMPHRCTVVENPGGWVFGFFGKFFLGGYLGFWENQCGGGSFLLHFYVEVFKILYRGYMRCPPLPPPVCIYEPNDAFSIILFYWMRPAWGKRTAQSLFIIQLITLSVITLRGAHCIMITKQWSQFGRVDFKEWSAYKILLHGTEWIVSLSADCDQSQKKTKKNNDNNEGTPN
jgi:hypothetical protein